MEVIGQGWRRIRGEVYISRSPENRGRKAVRMRIL